MKASCSFLLVIAVQFCTAYTEVVLPGLVGTAGSSSKAVGSAKAAFTPQVAFKCGFRNQYLTESGEWKTDPDARANCLTGKLDVLKYCRRVYRKLTVTNIVESSHFVEVDKWCRVEGSPCKWSFWLKPYRCVVGDFESETLLVPRGCHFDHINRDELCKDFNYWNQTAIEHCQRRGDSHSVYSFAMLEPCGVDMFSGVEFVCCPKNKNDAKSDVHIDSISVKVKPEVKEVFENHDVLDLNEHGKLASTKKPPVTVSLNQNDRVKTDKPNTKDSLFTATDEVFDEDDDDDDDDEDDDDDDDDDEDEDDEIAVTDSKSLYLRVADPKNEHEAYRNALNDLNKEHRNKVSKVMKEWSELEVRYIKMKAKDPVHAEKFKTDMNTRFQKTVAALEKQNVEERGQIEQLHQQRIVANLNEKKRHALMEFHQLYSKREDPDPSAVLHALKAYVRAEEKERLHLINHYRHLLKTRMSDAMASEADLLTKLLEIDRRLRSTYDLLTEHPKIDAKINTAIVDFFYVYRRENTPDLPDTFPDGLLTADQYRDLMEVYRRQVTPKPAVTVAPQETVTDTADYVRLRPWSDSSNLPEEIKDSKKAFVPTVAREKAYASSESDADFYGSLNMKHSQAHDFSFNEESLRKPIPAVSNAGYVLLSVASVFVVIAVMCGVFIIRHRSSRAGQGFMQVSACTPEEYHVANMQITGYENPAYKYFEERA